jgi:hypothetical protein
MNVVGLIFPPFIFCSVLELRAPAPPYPVPVLGVVLWLSFFVWPVIRTTLSLYTNKTQFNYHVCLLSFFLELGNRSLREERKVYIHIYISSQRFDLYVLFDAFLFIYFLLDSCLNGLPLCIFSFLIYWISQIK